MLYKMLYKDYYLVKYDYIPDGFGSYKLVELSKETIQGIITIKSRKTYIKNSGLVEEQLLRFHCDKDVKLSIGDKIVDPVSNEEYEILQNTRIILPPMGSDIDFQVIELDFK